MATRLTAYHRTNCEAIVHCIHDHGFVPKSTGIYGPGFYGTYDYASQLKRRMVNTYGEFVLRVQVDITNFLIFDEKLQQKYGVGSVSKQLQAKGINQRIQSYAYMNYAYSSEIAIKLAAQTQVRSKFAGMLFTGQQDGKVIVVWQLKRVKPISYYKISHYHVNRDKFMHSKFVAWQALGDKPKMSLQTWLKRQRKDVLAKVLKKYEQYDTPAQQQFFWYTFFNVYKTNPQILQPVVSWLTSKQSNAWFAQNPQHGLGRLATIKEIYTRSLWATTPITNTNATWVVSRRLLRLQTLQWWEQNKQAIIALYDKSDQSKTIKKQQTAMDAYLRRLCYSLHRGTKVYKEITDIMER